MVPKLQKMGAVNILASMLVDRILSREERLDGRRENLVCREEMRDELL